ncbi:MAG: sigma-54-dependent Fis family transcriptional regulator [Polyangiaceae bacterium]|nr:sigma-54-dependent Fis family transcriptional regulator [Polyangiaceae bacterium]
MGTRILFIDDDRDFLGLVRAGLKDRFELLTASGGDEALGILEHEDVSAVVTDVNLGRPAAGGIRMDGIELCRRIVERLPDIPVLVVTAFGSLDTAIAAIRVGAYDFVSKPFEIEALALAIDRAVALRSLREQVKRLEKRDSESRPTGLMGSSLAMHRVLDLVDRIKDNDVTALVTGESGTGKELVARTLHERSRRNRGPFIAINCAALPETLLESELFGHVRGAFTDARAAHAGLFVQANGGTLLLDEIGELPLALQPKLLRALQERRVRPLGGMQEVPFDVRLIAATNRDLEELVEQGRFRDDLLYRVNVVTIELPPLRARGQDVLLLAQHFLSHFAKQMEKNVTSLSPEVADRIQRYSWPGNVRELSNCMERAVALARFEQVVPGDLPDKLFGTQAPIETGDDDEIVPLEEVERRYILRAFEKLGRNKSLTAQTLGVDRKTLYRRLEKWGVSDAKA